MMPMMMPMMGMKPGEMKDGQPQFPFPMPMMPMKPGEQNQAYPMYPGFPYGFYGYGAQTNSGMMMQPQMMAQMPSNPDANKGKIPSD
jgi:hypothetical protein